MSIPVYERCGHKTQDISPAKARYFVRSQAMHMVVDDQLDQGVQLDRCLQHVDIPYQLLADILTATQAPTRRRIHPWLEQITANAAVAAGLLVSTEQDHQLAFTDRGQVVLQQAYAKLLHRDLDRGIELMGAFTSILRNAVRDAHATWTGAEAPQSWRDTLQAAWDHMEGMPAPYQVFRNHLGAVPERMVGLLVQVDPRNAERLLREAL